MPLDTEKIRQLREELKLSQEDAAQRAGLSNRQHWHQIESGGKPNVTLETLERIAKALKTTPCDLIKR